MPLYPGHWQTLKNAELIAADVLEIGDGYRAKNSELGAAGLPFARAGNISGGFDFSSADYLAEEGLGRAGSKISRPGDVVFTSKGTVGRFAYVSEQTPQFVYSPQLCYWRVLMPEIIDPSFLFFWMHGHHFRAQVNQVKGLTDMADYVSLTNQRKMVISAPRIDQQRKIASILSAYDDLIENNTRRIAILEELAQAIYREWFVNFRFPGHEDVEMVESELGLIPEGWEVLSIGKVVKTLGGGTPSTKAPEYWEDGEITWFSPRDLTAAGAMFISESGRQINDLGLRKSSAQLFPPYSVMMTSRATIGVTAINTSEACTNQGFITCVPNSRAPLYQLYFWIKDSFDIINTLASGATFKEINKTTFRGLPFPVADSETRSRFSHIMAPIGRQIEVLQRQSTVLRQTRDLLLPKLVSGEIDVSALKADPEEVLAPA